MTKKRTTAQQRAREIQHAPGSRLTYGRALETARRSLTPDQAREVLRILAEDEHQDVSISWRDRFRSHLAVTQEADWPNMEHAVELSDDLFRLTGLPAPEDGLLGIPLALKFFPLARLRSAWEQGNTSSFACASVAASPAHCVTSCVTRTSSARARTIWSTECGGLQRAARHDGR